MKDKNKTATPRQVRRLLRSSRRAALATALARDGSAHPYASLVLFGLDASLRPVLLLSDLAEHSRNIALDRRACLLVDEADEQGDPLAGTRASILGHLEVCSDDEARRRYLARHPSAAGYVDFADFRFYRLHPQQVHLVAGFGRIHWLSWTDVTRPLCTCDPLSQREAELIAEVNDTMGETMARIARTLLGLEGDNWLVTGIDMEGCDLRAGARIARLDFASPVSDTRAWRNALLRLARKANDGRKGRS